MYSWEAKDISYDETKVISKWRVLSMLDYVERLIQEKNYGQALRVIKNYKKFTNNLNESTYNTLTPAEEHYANAFKKDNWVGF
jgi:hypothetical protein